MMATVLAMAEVCPHSGEWIHLGATSNDILDTATGLQIKASFDILEPKLKKLLALLLDLAVKNKNLVCAGRTHGQIAVPTTYGLRFAIWASEIARHIERLQQLRPRAAVGKMSGAVGTQAAFGQMGMQIQSSVMASWGCTRSTYPIRWCSGTGTQRWSAGWLWSPQPWTRSSWRCAPCSALRSPR